MKGSSYPRNSWIQSHQNFRNNIKIYLCWSALTVTCSCAILQPTFMRTVAYKATVSPICYWDNTSKTIIFSYPKIENRKKMAISLHVVTLLLTPFHSQPSGCSIACLNTSWKNSIYGNLLLHVTRFHIHIYIYICLYLYICMSFTSLLQSSRVFVCLHSSPWWGCCWLPSSSQTGK